MSSSQIKDQTPRQLRYQRKTVAGLCSSGACSAKAKAGYTLCDSHLRQMLRNVTDLYKRRAEQRLCLRCGSRPQFWGKRCVICRQMVSKDPLPRGARAALRKYRALEQQGSVEARREAVRIAARELIARGGLKEGEKEAVRLYFGLEDNAWRTLEQVAQLMHVSAQRVYQLLMPSKTILASSLANAPWRSAKRTRKRGISVELLSIGDNFSSCRHSRGKFLQGKSAIRKPYGLSTVVLEGLPIFRCSECGEEKLRIPQEQELYDILARALLCKPDTLSGKELRFLRSVAGMNLAEFAESLQVTTQTLQRWETLRAMSFVNEIASRVVIASIILDDEDSCQLFTIPEKVRDGIPKPGVIMAEWIEGTRRWRLSQH